MMANLLALRAALDQLDPQAVGELLVESAALEGYAVAQDGGVQVALDTRSPTICGARVWHATWYARCRRCARTPAWRSPI
jgi:hypothetical protein